MKLLLLVGWTVAALAQAQHADGGGPELPTAGPAAEDGGANSDGRADPLNPSASGIVADAGSPMASVDAGTTPVATDSIPPTPTASVGPPPDAGASPPAPAAAAPPEEPAPEPQGPQFIILAAGLLPDSAGPLGHGATYHLGYQGYFAVLPFLGVDFRLSLQPESFDAPGDRGSSFALRFIPREWHPLDGVSLVLYPLSSTRLRVGEEPLLSWGGGPYSLTDSDAALGLRLNYRRAIAELAVKTGVLRHPLTNALQSHLAVFARGSYATPFNVTAGLSAAWIPMGPIPGLALRGTDVPMTTLGGAARLRYHHGGRVSPIFVANRAATAPEFFEQLAVRAPVSVAPGLLVDAEVSYLSQSLEDPDVVGRAKQQDGVAAKLAVTGSAARARAQLFATYRSLAFLGADRPELQGFTAFGADSAPRDEYRAELSADYAWVLGDFVLRPGFVAELIHDAAYSNPTNFGGNAPPSGLGSGPLVVRRDPDARYPLPAGVTPRLGYRVAATFAADLTRYFRVHLDAGYRYDANRVRRVDATSAVTELLPPHVWAGFAYVQLRL